MINRCYLLLIIALPMFVAGCGSSMPSYDEKTLKAAEHFGKIAAAYKAAYQQNRKPPASAEELKPFLKKHGDPDALLTSLLDGKPLVIVPGPPPNTPAGPGETPVIAYEQDGVGGRRMTVDSRGTIVIMESAEFNSLKFPAGHKPAGR